MVNLGSINISQKMTGVKFQAQDANGDPVVSFNGLQLSTDQPGNLSFVNQQGTNDLPLGSTFTVDIVATGITTGAATINAVGQQGNGMPTFTTNAILAVVANPNQPGLPVMWAITGGTVVPQ